MSLPWVEIIGGLVTVIVAVISSLGVVYKVSKGSTLDEKRLQLDNSTNKLNAEASMRADLRQQLQDLRNEFNNLRDKYDLILKENGELRAELSSIRATMSLKISMFETARQNIPIPIWLKDTNGVMLSLNPAYEEIFLLPRNLTKEDYIGNTDYDVWPKKIADVFSENDRLVYTTGKTWQGTELISDKNGNTHPWHIMKYVRYSGDTKIGVEGIAFPDTVPGKDPVIEPNLED